MCSSVWVNESRQHTIMAVATATVLAIALLFRPIASMDSGLWGPADPWNNGDFLGAQWLFWAAAQTGDPTAWLHWPWGEDDALTAFPNPFDAWLLGPWVADVPLAHWWNPMMLGHHVLNVAASVVLARSAGARPVAAAMAGALVASTPLMLHEHTLGHTLTAAVWPGLFGLSALLTGRSKQAGLWIGVQGLAYLYTGLFVGLVAIALRPKRGLLTALIPMLPYLALLAPQMEVATAVPPPDGFTALPLNGLWGAASQPQVQLQPLLAMAGLGLVLGNHTHRTTRRRLIGAAAVLLFLALGTHFVWARGEPALGASPAQWLFGVPGLERMHHPIRLGLLATPLLAAAAALSVNKLPSAWPLAALLACGLNWKTIDNTAAWPAPAEPPGTATAKWLAQHADAVVDLGSTHMQALALQTIHEKPILAGFHPRERPHPNVDARVFERVSAWAEGIEQPGLADHLKRLGYSHVIAIDRGPQRSPSITAVQRDLGEPVFPGVYAL